MLEFYINEILGLKVFVVIMVKIVLIKYWGMLFFRCVGCGVWLVFVWLRELYCVVVFG